MSTKIETSTFTISKNYNDELKGLQSVSIKLELNYRMNTFKLKTKNDNNQFFFQNTHCPEKWKTIGECIIEAVEFAEKELERAQKIAV